MITCRLIGGLGNQLFQIATTLAYSYEYGVEAIFEESWICLGQGHHPDFYKNNIYKKLQFGMKNIENFYEDYTIYEYNKIKYQDDLLICGYFQNEKYFIKYSENIKNIFAMDKSMADKFISQYDIDTNVCSIHIRRGDYINHHIQPIITLKYYLSAIDLFDEDTKFLIFSDDIYWCRNNFIGDKFVFVDNNPDYIDLYLMSLCNNNIISNSTFGWWGSWLNFTPSKKVIAPKQWTCDDREIGCTHIIRI